MASEGEIALQVNSQHEERRELRTDPRGKLTFRRKQKGCPPEKQEGKPEVRREPEKNRSRGRQSFGKGAMTLVRGANATGLARSRRVYGAEQSVALQAPSFTVSPTGC